MSPTVSRDYVCCGVAGCENPIYADGLCRKHYNTLQHRRRLLMLPNLTVSERDKLDSLYREVDIAQELYDQQLRVERRVRLRRQIRAARAEIVILEKKGARPEFRMKLMIERQMEKVIRYKPAYVE